MKPAFYVTLAFVGWFLLVAALLLAVAWFWGEPA